MLARSQKVIPPGASTFHLSNAARQFAKVWTASHRKSKAWQKEIDTYDELIKVFRENNNFKNQAVSVWRD